jgi:diguanylate cyclase (GGDEF)-like protein
MLNASVDPNSLSSRDMLILRLSMLIGGALIALFMMSDLKLVPREMTGAYFQNRAFLQLPIVLSVFAFSFSRYFSRFAQPVFLLAILGLTYANYYLIHLCWEQAGFSFPYEGTVLYAFFGFFVFGMTFPYALSLMILSSLGFVGLMLLDPVYGERTPTNVAFVVGSLFIGVIGRHRLDRLLGELKEANEQLMTLSTTDGLTQLLNRRAFMSQSERLFDLQRRSGQSLAVFMIDLDHFKEFNDRYGHQEGDVAIRCQADILRQVFKRQTDVLGRYGGEEFIAVTAGQGADRCAQQATEILEQWQERSIPNEGGPEGGLLSCSIGICEGAVAQFNSLEDMIRVADEALYRAKERGRATYEVAELAR